MDTRGLIEQTGEMVKGVIKEYAGMVTGDEQLLAEGRADREGADTGAGADADSGADASSERTEAPAGPAGTGRPT
ncbi:hypothetical protein OG500_01580 [Kitasatospora sp. NBC_01250]|uniref:hypothetical protein n=1 Tax=unclassified Kitasatospora TaxID=2633591 RepID=UPI002E154C5B|nr:MULTISPECIES: hypothetical protein [unclassified Kitasatospora]WSJ64880.1 hypothetical protein OG294_01515 [Kitasatospora sp. NBC_01302]